jgi:hypothetical protein
MLTKSHMNRKACVLDGGNVAVSSVGQGTLVEKVVVGVADMEFIFYFLKEPNQRSHCAIAMYVLCNMFQVHLPDHGKCTCETVEARRRCICSREDVFARFTAFLGGRARVRWMCSLQNSVRARNGVLR